MKSALTEVVGLYEAVFEDILLMHPSIHKREINRDLSRLREASMVSGLPLFTITLPSICKFLHRSLDDGSLGVDRPPLTGAKSRDDLRPKFLYGLWSLIFEMDGTLRSEVDISAISSLRQVLLVVKKLKLKCEQRYVDMAIADFREIEKSLPTSWDDTWDCNDPIWSRRDGHPIWGPITMDKCETDLFNTSHPVLLNGIEPDWRGLRNFVARISSQLGDLYPFEVKPKHGPGAVSEDTPYTKYDGYFWTERLESVFPYDWFGAPSPEYLDYVRYVEHPSRLIAVPKTQSGPRLIAAEPTCHQWIQGGLQRWLEQAIPKTILGNCIDFRSQKTSRLLALESSGSRQYCTIDLSSASDRLTTRLVEYCFQGNRSLLDALHACRTRCVEVEPHELILLRKFSTQGSACTFPVQTIVFSLLAIWACALTYNKKDWKSLTGFAKQVRVFGDDIIVPNDVYPVLTSLLGECQLKVNESKSFSNGKFRESCGMDAYDGQDVTPAYFRQLLGSAPTSLESVIQCSNNFHKKGYWHAADYLLKTVLVQDLAKIPVVRIHEDSDGRTQDDGALGLASFTGSSVQHLPRRWNPDYQRHEVQVLAISNKVVKTRAKGHGDLLQFFSEEPDPDLPYSGGQVTDVKSRKALAWVDEAKQIG